MEDTIADALEHSRSLAGAGGRDVFDASADHFLGVTLRNLRQAAAELAGAPEGASEAVPVADAGLEEEEALLLAPEAYATFEDAPEGADDVMVLESAPAAGADAGAYPGMYEDEPASFVLDEASAPAAFDAATEAELEALPQQYSEDGTWALESGASEQPLDMTNYDLNYDMSNYDAEAADAAAPADEPEVLDAGTMEVAPGEDGFHDDSVLEEMTGDWLDPFAGQEPAPEQLAPEVGQAQLASPADIAKATGADAAAAELQRQANAAKQSAGAAAAAAAARAAAEAAAARNATAEALNAKLAQARAKAEQAAAAPAAAAGAAHKKALSMPAVVGLAVVGAAVVVAAAAAFIFTRAKKAPAPAKAPAAKAAAAGRPRQSSGGGDLERGRPGWRFSRGGAK